MATTVDSWKIFSQLKRRLQFPIVHVRSAGTCSRVASCRISDVHRLTAFPHSHCMAMYFVNLSWYYSYVVACSTGIYTLL